MDGNQHYKPELPPVVTAFFVAATGVSGFTTMTNAAMNPETSGLPVALSVTGACIACGITALGAAAFVKVIKDHGPKL